MDATYSSIHFLIAIAHITLKTKDKGTSVRNFVLLVLWLKTIIPSIAPKDAKMYAGAMSINSLMRHLLWRALNLSMPYIIKSTLFHAVTAI